MKNSKSVRGNLLAKLFSGFVFIVTSFITIFSFICVIFMTAFGAYDSSKDAAINSMRDSLYYRIIENHKTDAIELCLFDEKDVSIFDDTNFRFRILDEDGSVILTNCKENDGKYIYKTKQTFDYPLEQRVFDDESKEVIHKIITKLYTVECFVDGKFEVSDQFWFINEFIHIIFQLRFLVILVCIVGAFATIVSFAFLMISARYHDNQETPTLGLLDKIHLEFVIAFLILLGYGELIILDGISLFSVSMAILAVLMVLFDTTILLLVCMSLATRLRCRSFWKTTLVYTILRGIYLLLKKLFSLFIKIVSYIPVLWQLIFAIALFCIAELCFLVICGTDDIFVLFFFEKIVFIPLIFYVAYMLYKLEETSKKITQGDMTATVDTKYFLGTFKKQGENLNSIKLGIASAVEDKMKSERFKTELITNVSHDIKTPLTSIINYVDLLNKEDLQNETAKEYIQIISKNSDRLKKLVVDLVDASKASSGVLKLDMQPMKIDVLLEQIAGEYVERLLANNLELIMRKPEESIQIMADGQRIYRVFDNLMNNICKYALANTRVYLLLEKEDDKAIISFKNISATELDMSANDLMERFVRGDKSRNTEGSGLGLSIAESLTKLQNGDFQIQLDGDLFKIIITFPVIE